jgi:hypothetical protein
LQQLIRLCGPDEISLYIPSPRLDELGQMC